MLPKATIVCVFAFLSLISIAPAAAQQRSPALQQQAVQMQAVATCKVGGKQVMAGQIVADARGGRLRQRQCRGGRLVAFSPQAASASLKADQPGDTRFECGSGGCNCYGDDDCLKLVDSGDCDGNPLVCDPNNPKSCHCD